MVLTDIQIRGQEDQVKEIFGDYLVKLQRDQRDRNQEGKIRLTATGDLTHK